MLFSIMENKDQYQSINQSVRYYKVPASVEKGAALNSLLEKIRNTPEKQPRTIRMNSLIITITSVAAAAVIIIAFLLTGNQETIQNGTMQASAFRLPDQTRVVLAPGASVKYAGRFSNRTVFLTGEGYFEVVPGSKFIVRTTAGKISVLGTRFNVKVSGNDLEVNCFSGNLKVNAHQEEKLLGKGQGVSVSSSGSKQLDLGGIEFPPVALFRISGQNIALNTLFADVESFFGVTIRYQSASIRHYTGIFETGSLENALILICEPLGLEYTISDNNTVIIEEGRP